MLVLSRKPNEKILFPHLGIRVQVLRVNGNAVRLGIEAPKNIAVVREEIADERQQPAEESLLAKLPSEVRHAIRNRLNTAVIGLHLLCRKLETGQVDGAEDTVRNVLRELDAIDKEVGGGGRQRENRPFARRALLVDDNRNESELLAGYLRSYGCEVDIAYDGVEALEYLDEHEKPEFVLLDMQMPRLNGAQTIQCIRQNPALDGIRVFAVSGLDSFDADVAIGPQGVDRWFTKPLKPDELVDEMRRDRAETA